MAFNKVAFINKFVYIISFDFEYAANINKRNKKMTKKVDF